MPEIKPAPDLQCAKAHEYKNFLAPPARNFYSVDGAVVPLKNGKLANDGKQILRRIEVETAEECTSSAVGTDSRL